VRALVVSTSNHRGALTAVRRLHKAGWTAIAATSDPKGLVSWSRATSAVYAVPPPKLGAEQFVAAVTDAVRRSGAEVVFPSDDADLIALSQFRDRIPAVVPVASHDVVLGLVDKLELVRASRRAGLEVPETWLADAQGLSDATYPVVVKPRFHWLPSHGADAPSRFSVKVCGDADSAAEHVGLLRGFGADPILQRHVSGTPVNVHLVSDRTGAVLGLDEQDSAELFSPPGAGSRVRSTTVAVEPVLEAGIRRLIAETGWFGFAGIALLRGDDGVPRVIDFNGRIPAALAASAGAGPDYLVAWAALATDRPVSPLRAARVGSRFHWLEGDVRRALVERRGGLARDLAGTLAYAVGANHTVFSLDDPGVAARHVLRQLRRAANLPRNRGKLAELLGRPRPAAQASADERPASRRSFSMPNRTSGPGSDTSENS
jgi:hypothetical protein